MILKVLADVQLRKSKFHKERSAGTVKSIYKIFGEWLNETGLSRARTRDISTQNISSYISWLQTNPGRVSNRTVNNHLGCLTDFFNYAKVNFKGSVGKNPCEGIGKLPSRSESHEVYPDELFQKVVAHMRETDPYLAFFARFIVYCFMRPSEIRTIQLKHLDLNEGLIRMPIKSMKTDITLKYIMDCFLPELQAKNLHEYNPNFYLFTRSGIPGPYPASKNLFTERFAKVRKKFNLTKNHTMYGMRHTAVCQLLRAGTEWHEIMKRTGHEDMASFQKYARQVFAEPPKDISSNYSVHL